MLDIPAGHFYLGTTVDSDEPVLYEASNLTTHGVIVGMTGSGKTGLGMIVLEEALMQGVPTLIIDPKGDMGNLLLTFPNLAGSDFEPWVSESDAQREGVSVADLANSTAELWKSGLERSQIDGPTRLGELRKNVDFTIYTPGSTSGVPLNLVGSLAAPPGGTDAETVQDEVDGFTQSLLGLAGIDSDPLSGREHILIANIINHFWTAGRDLDLATLIGQVQAPPMRKLGVIELDMFFPPADRMKLAMKLNGLVASPAFASWAQGPALDIQSMLYGDGGRPQAAVVSIAHLSDEERQFVVTLLLSKLVTWMRSQPGTSELRALVYMDEVFGFVPPTAAPPSKKPILTILKQARAFGVGLVLSTQNPVDIDYKAISNAGTWMIGRLQTERDKKRLLDGMSSSDGEVDIGQIDETISGLDKRQFVLHSTKESGPQVFGTRWAMSYLPGPMTREQINTLTADSPRREVAPPAAGDPTSPATQAATGAEPALASDETAVAPTVADGIDVKYIDPGAPWSESVGAVAGGKRLVAGLAVRIDLLYDETAADLRHEVEWEAIITPLDGKADPDDAIAVDYDDRDLRDEAPEGAAYVLPDAKIHTKTFFTQAQSAIKDHLYRNEEITLFKNAGLKLYSRVGESRDDFEARCRAVADDEADADIDKLREAVDKKKDRLREQMAAAQDRIREAEHDEQSRGQEMLVSGALDLIGGLLGGRKRGRSLGRGLSSKRRMKGKASERVRTAENRYAEKAENLEELAEELDEDIMEILEEWQEKAGDIKETVIGLEKTDIGIDDIALVWIPTD